MVVRWKNYKEQPPIIGIEVLAFHRDWINEDNPKGIRIGFRTEDDFISAHWWNYQDCYMTISHAECDDNESFSEKIRNSIEPELWIPLTYLTDLLKIAL